MIYTVPMLLSKSIDRHIIPGICKAYERFFIVFRMNDIMAEVTRSYSGNQNLIDSHNTAKKRNENYISEIGSAPPGSRKGNKPSVNNPTPDEVSIDARSLNEYMSIEPTWITVTVTMPNNGATFPVLVGVKVLPVLLKDEEYAFEKLIDDRYAGKIDSLFKKLYRSIMRSMLNIVYAVWPIPVFGPHRSADSPARGSVKDDLFFNKSGYYMSRRIIACLDYNEVPDDFFRDAGKINRLYKLYWNALFLYDNVNRNLYFAPPEYRGQVSILPYSYLNTLTKQQSSAYDIEEQKKLKSSPLFNMRKIPASKLMESVNKYNFEKLLVEKSQLLKEEFDENSLINMDKYTMKNFIQKHGLKKIAYSLKNFDKAIKLKNPEMMVKSLSIFPEVSMKSVEIYALKNMGPSFVSNYKYCQKVLIASTDIPQNLIKPVASALVILAGNSLKILRLLLTKFVDAYRKRKAAIYKNPDSNGIDLGNTLAYVILASIIAGSAVLLTAGVLGTYHILQVFLNINNNMSLESLTNMLKIPYKEIEDKLLPNLNLYEMEMVSSHQPETLSALEKLKYFFTNSPETQDHNWFFTILTKLGFDEKVLYEFNSTAYFAMGMLICFIFIIIIQNSIRGLVRFSQPVTRV